MPRRRRVVLRNRIVRGTARTCGSDNVDKGGSAPGCLVEYPVGHTEKAPAADAQASRSQPVGEAATEPSTRSVATESTGLMEALEAHVSKHVVPFLATGVLPIRLNDRTTDRLCSQLGPRGVHCSRYACIRPTAPSDGTTLLCTMVLTSAERVLSSSDHLASIVAKPGNTGDRLEHRPRRVAGTPPFPPQAGEAVP